MYSAVLIMALSATPATAGWGHGCHSCHGCYGCNGCHGCYGGYGGYGNGWYSGCYLSYGGYGYGHGYGWGGNGWGSAGWGGAGWGCSGCYGCYGCNGWGCYGGYGCWGSALTAPLYLAPGATLAPGGAATPPAEPVPPPKKETKKPNGEGAARLIIDLPDQARLYIDDRAIETASGQRSFRTPRLEPGQAYYYMVRVELDRDGRTYSDTRQVVVRAGQTVHASFTQLASTPAGPTVAAAAQ
jgi:uncharacterized protein (TIGR03000 family)